MGIQINGNTDTVASTTSGGSVTLPSATLPAVSNISATRVNVSGVSTFTTGPVLIGSGTITGTASQLLQVTGGAYVSGNIGVGITNPQYNLEIAGSENVTTQISLWGKTIGQPQTLVEPGRIYATAAGLGPGDLLLQPTGGNIGVATISPGTKLDVRGGNDTIIRAKVASGQYGGIMLLSEEGNDLTLGYARNSSNYGNDTSAGDLSIKATSSSAVNLHFVVGSGNATTKMKISSGGDVTIPNGNLVIGTSGKGIDFSATANSSGTMTSELLADYEEGTWTPGISGTGGGTYTAGSGNVGRYVKVGNLVTASATIEWTARPVAYSGLLIVTGLPFSALNVSGYRAAAIIPGQSVGIYASGSYTQLKGGIDWNNSFVYVVQAAETISAGTNYNHTPTVLSTGAIYGFTITYISN